MVSLKIVSTSGMTLVMMGAILLASSRRFSAITAPVGHMDYGFWSGLALLAVGVVIALSGLIWMERKPEHRSKLLEKPLV